MRARHIALKSWMVAIVVIAGFVCLVPIKPPGRASAIQTGDKRGVGLQAGPLKEWPGKAKRFALIIGVDQYADTQMTTLSGAANDAKTLAEALVRYAGFPTEQVILLASNQPAERQPTRGNILRRISNLSAIVPKDGLLLVAFAGHGMERGGQAFLLPTDAQVSNDVDLLEQTAINVAQMKEWIRKIGVGQVVVILDACRNDPAGRANVDNPLTAAYTHGFNFDVRNREVIAFATLYATEVGHRAYEYKEKRQGYFTWALVEGLKGGAANAQGEVTLAGLVKYLQETVPKRVLLDLGRDKNQRPFAVIEGYKADELVVAVVTPSTLRDDSNTAKTTTDPATLELEYWRKIKDSKNPASFREYLKQYPNGEFVELAQSRLRELGSATASPGEKSALTVMENPELIGKRNLNQYQVNFYSLDKECFVGRQYAAAVDRIAEFAEDPVITEYVNRVAQNLVLHSDAKVPFTIKVINSAEVRSLPLPGGFLYINAGLMLAANNEAEFAGAVAHQIAHIAARHGVEQASKGQIMDWESLPSISARGWGGFPGRQANGLKIPAGFIQFSRPMEEQADMLAAQYMWAAGYDPHRLATFFERLQAEEKNKSRKIASIFSLHTLTSGWIDKINALIERFPDRGEYTINTSEFNQVKARLNNQISR